MLVTCYFVSWIYLLPDNHPFIATRQRWTWIYLFFQLNFFYFMFVTAIPGTKSKIALSAVRVRQVSAGTGTLTWQSSWFIVKVSVWSRCPLTAGAGGGRYYWHTVYCTMHQCCWLFAHGYTLSQSRGCSLSLCIGATLFGGTEGGCLCIAMHRNVLFDSLTGGGYNLMWSMTIMEWVHIAWNGCIFGNPSEAG